MATVQEKIDQFHEKLAKIEMGGGQKRIDKQRQDDSKRTVDSSF